MPTCYIHVTDKKQKSSSSRKAGGIQPVQKRYAEARLYYYGARYYNPRESLWLSTDPLSGYNPVMESEHYIDGQHNGGVYNSFNLNTYIYCYQNPVLFVDPNGKQAEFWKGMKDGFVGTFKGVKDLVTDPVGTIKSAVSNYSWKDYGEGVANTVTLGTYDYAKGAYKSATGDEYGSGVIVGQKAAEASIAVATEGAGRAIKGVKGIKGAGGSNAIKSIDKFIELANSLDKNGLSVIGRALQKHAGRERSSFSDIKFSGKTANKDGLKVLNDILSSKDKVIKDLDYGTKNIFDKTTGRGVNVSRNGTFNGFRDLKGQ